MSIEDKKLLGRIGVVILIFFLLITGLVSTLPFFWDTIQFGSIHAEYFTQTGFNSFLLPDQIDSGHPPFFGFYIALVWKFFGKNLMVSHLAMMPVLVLYVYSSLKLSAYLIPGTLSKWLTLALVLDTTFLAQASLISPDVGVSAFFLLLIYGILSDHHASRFYGALGLSLLSLRGIILVFFMLWFDFLQATRSEDTKSRIPKLVYAYLPFVLCGIGFIVFHFIDKGWVVIHPDSPWAPSFSHVGLVGLIKNFLTFGWRLIDLGHVFITIPTVILLYKVGGQTMINKKMRQLVLLVIFTVLYLMPQVFFSGLMGYRYFIPFYLATTLLVFYGLYYYLKHRLQTTLISIVLIFGMLSGHLWIYPRYLSRGWDSSLAYLPYSQLMDKAKSYLNNMDIPYSMVGTAFPNLRSEYFTHLNKNRRIFKSKDLENDKYILYSNVMNDFSEMEIKELFHEWNVVQGWKKGAVEVILFKK